MLLLFILIVLAFANQEEAQNARLREANRVLLRALREVTLDTEVAVGDEESVAGCSPVCKPDEICWAEMNYCYNEAALKREISVGQFKAGSKGLRQKSVEESIGSGGICGNCDGCLRNGVCWEYSANGISGPVDGTHCTNVDGVDCTPSDIAVAASNQRLARENAKLVYEIEAALGGKEIQPRSPASLLKEKAVSGGSGIVDAVCPRDNADREEGMCDTDHERSGSTWCGYCKYGMTINRPFPYVNDWCCKKEERNGGNCKCHY